MQRLSKQLHLCVLLGLTLGTTLARTQTTHWEWRGLALGAGPFVVPALPYTTKALEPSINQDLLESHHKVHAACTTNFNKTLAAVPDLYIHWKYKRYFADISGALVVSNLNSIPEKLARLDGAQTVTEQNRTFVRHNAGGHYNHSLYWQMMKPNGGGEPTGRLATTIKKEFGSFSRFKQEFTKAALARADDGWTWLSLEGGKLRIETSLGEESPLSSGRPALLGIDLWDHAYRPQYKSRSDYVTAWFKIVNWDFVAERYTRLKPTE